MSEYTLRQRLKMRYYKAIHGGQYHPLTRFATWLAYRWGINSQDNGDDIEYIDTRDNGDVIFYNNDLRRYMVVPKEEMPTND